VSHVLAALGIGAEPARHSLRFTFGWTTTLTEADQAAEIVLSALDGAG
jgi:cysteine sulfinate desulfinase/cysteine desulfurase-like protein